MPATAFSADILQSNKTEAAQVLPSLGMSHILQPRHQQLHWLMTATTVMAKLKANNMHKPIFVLLYYGYRFCCCIGATRKTLIAGTVCPVTHDNCSVSATHTACPYNLCNRNTFQLNSHTFKVRELSLNDIV
jgi:hypothetical protein